MNSRTASLPDLVAERRRNTALSLSEGFAGAQHEGALAATNSSWPPRPGAQKEALLKQQRRDEDMHNGLARVLPLYYRTRQLVLSTEKSGHRVPQKMMSDLRNLEKAVAKELRHIHPLLFTRFDDAQLDRFLRAMPFLRLSSGRWLFGSEALNAAWPETAQQRSFILLSGKIMLFLDPNGLGEGKLVKAGQIFGEKQFRLGEETMDDLVVAAAHCEEPCIVGLLNTDALEAAFADRAFGNRRIAQVVRHAPALQRVVLADPDPTAPRVEMEKMDYKQKRELFEQGSTGPVKMALEELAKVSSAIHILPKQRLQLDQPLEDNVFMVTQGSLNVQCDVTLTEQLDALPPRKVRIKIHLDKAEKLAGSSIFDKLDAYCLVKMGEHKRFQSPVQWNVGVNPIFDYSGVLTYNQEEDITFMVMDHDKFSADDLCGSCTLKVSDLYDGWKGKVELQRPKRSLGMWKEDELAMESAGKLFFSVSWDYEKVSSLMRTPKEKTWHQQVVFTLKKNDGWGFEQVMLGSIFKRTLEQAASTLPFLLNLDNFELVGGQMKGDNDKITILKVSKKRFVDFIRKSQKENQFLQACRGSVLDKQQIIKAIIRRMIDRWEAEEQAALMQRGIFEIKDEVETMDPSKFRVAYRGVKAVITVRNALHLSGGGWFDKLDPYAIVRFRGNKQEFRTSVLQDAGGDPIWDCEGELTYNGEVALEISIWDYDKYSSDDLLATGIIQVEQFCNGFEGMVPLSSPGEKKKRTMKQALVTISIVWSALGAAPEAIKDRSFGSTGPRPITQ